MELSTFMRGQGSHLYDNSTGIVMNFCAIVHYNYHSWAITSHLFVSGPTSTTLRGAVFQTIGLKHLMD